MTKRADFFIILCKGGDSNIKTTEIINRNRKAIFGFAALWILANHTWIYIFLLHPSLHEVEKFLKTTGFCGVDIFLFLSGMTLHHSLKGRTLPSFYYRRLKKVYLPFFLCGIILAVSGKWTLGYFLGCVSCVNFYARYVYSLLWFVPMIFTFYLIFPFYYKLFSWVKWKTLFTAAVLAVWLVLSLLLKNTLRIDLYSMTNRIPIFVLGIYAGYLGENEKIRVHRLIPVAASVPVLLLGGYLAYRTCFDKIELLVPVPNCCIPNILMAVSLSILLGNLFDLLGKCLPGRCVNRFLGIFGTVSLEFYCIQEWLSKRFLPLIDGKVSYSLLNFCNLAAVCAAAYVLHYINEYFWKGLERVSPTLKRLG